VGAGGPGVIGDTSAPAIEARGPVRKVPVDVEVQNGACLGLRIDFTKNVDPQFRVIVAVSRYSSNHTHYQTTMTLIFKRKAKYQQKTCIYGTPQWCSFWQPHNSQPIHTTSRISGSSIAQRAEDCGPCVALTRN
jgi:hypothetical protein